jgi:hypothetical protein
VRGDDGRLVLARQAVSPLRRLSGGGRDEMHDNNFVPPPPPSQLPLQRPLELEPASGLGNSLHHHNQHGLHDHHHELVDAKRDVQWAACFPSRRSCCPTRSCPESGVGRRPECRPCAGATSCGPAGVWGISSPTPRALPNLPKRFTSPSRWRSTQLVLVVKMKVLPNLTCGDAPQAFLIKHACMCTRRTAGGAQD